MPSTIKRTNSGGKLNKIFTIKASSARAQNTKTKKNKKVTPAKKEYGSTSGTPDEQTKLIDTDPPKELKTTVNPTLRRTQSSFFEDAVTFAEGSIPQSMMIGLVIGTFCGVAAYIYYTVLEFLLDYLWHELPEKVMTIWPGFEEVTWLWIPFMATICAIGVGASVVFLGEPGDLAYTIKCVHEKAYIHVNHIMPMVAASQFSILGGGSLGPEAPLVAICASVGGFVSQQIFGQRTRNVVRKHTLMGMAGALAAFFGAPLGGSLFALEVNSRFGVEYFEHTVEAVFCGEVCLAVFRGLAGLPIAPIWTITAVRLEDASAVQALLGTALGLLGAFFAFIFAVFHANVMSMFGSLGLLDNSKAIYRGLLGVTVIIAMGLLMPQTMFWGEFEFQSLSNIAPASELEHIFPTTGLTGFEMTDFWSCFMVGIGKLIAVSFTVAGGYRGGFIFPFFAAGAALGRAVVFLFPAIPPQLATLCIAAGINVSITRTSLATTIILCFLAGEQKALSGVLAASLISLFVTGYMPFIKTQIVRGDINSAFYVQDDDAQVETDDHHGEV